MVKLLASTQIKRVRFSHLAPLINLMGMDTCQGQRSHLYIMCKFEKGRKSQVSYNGNTLGFQPKAEGSIPSTCSTIDRLEKLIIAYDILNVKI